VKNRVRWRDGEQRTTEESVCEEDFFDQRAEKRKDNAREVVLLSECIEATVLEGREERRNNTIRREAYGT